LDPIARLLVQRGVLPEPLVQRALASAKTRAAFLAELLLLGVPEPELAAVVAEHLGMPGVDLSRTTIDLDVLDLVPRVVAESDLILPLSTEGGRLHAAVSAGNDDLRVVDEVHFITGLVVSPYVALPGLLEHAIAAAYDARERGDRFWRGAGLSGDADSGVAVVTAKGLSTITKAPRTDEIIVQQVDLDQEDVLLLEVADDIVEGEEVLHSVRVGPPRVLVVDDDPDILRLVVKALQSKGYSIDTAVDGLEAEEKLKGQLPDVLLLDAMLPHVHGFEICGRIKASARMRALPVIIMSAVYRGWRFAQDVHESYGADDYLEKPFHISELLRRVELRLAQGPAQPAPQKEEAEKLYQEGMLLLEAGKPGQARKLLQQATLTDPLSARAAFALGRAMQEHGDHFGAITAYERAVELRPNLFPALRVLAALYQEKGFRRKAIETFERALHSAPDATSREAVRGKLIRLL
jgi:DNA-binding response OmpR family regulator